VTVALIQSAQGANGATLGATPTPGNTLLLWKSARDDFVPALQTGFTDIAAVTNGVPLTRRRGRMMYRVAQAGDTAGVAAGAEGQSSNNYTIMEWAGTYASFVAASDVASTSALICGGSISLDPTAEYVIVGGATVGRNDADFDGVGNPVDPLGGVTELYDIWPGGFSPLHWVGYRQVSAPSGSYTVGGTLFSAKSYCGVSVILVPLPSAPRGISGAPEYVIELYDSGATFGPNNKLGEIWDALTVGWSRYDRIPGKAFFSLPQSSASLAAIVPLLTHIAITRVTPNGDTLLYRGAVIDTDDTGDDVIVDAFDYISLLSLSRSGFKTLYPIKKLGSEIISPEWAAAKGATSSPLGFVVTGTIEDPLGTDEATFIKTNTQFGTLDQSRLQLFYDLTEMGRANTIHQTTFEIDLTNTFNFWKHKTGAATIAFVLGGNISDYKFLPGWSRYRNDIATIGVGSAGSSSEIVSTNAGEITAKGLRQDVTTLKTLAGIAGGATEADQQKAALDRALKNLTQQQSGLMLRVERGKVEPFVGFLMNDIVPIEISNGQDLITDSRRIVGIRCVYSEAGEDVDVTVVPVAT
jgi:hypothetical protein